jgi:predicted RNase H-like nuclease (RuvC/YqgF family)
MNNNDRVQDGNSESVREEAQRYDRKLLGENHELRRQIVEMYGENARLRSELCACEAQRSELARKLEEIRTPRGSRWPGTTLTVVAPTEMF